jgi:hypothetical protein
MKLELIRTYYPNGTNGQLLLNGDKVCSTIELPWKNNASQISCIPEGEYELRKRYSTKFGWHLLVMNVPGRQYILIHPANDAIKELKGCIAPVSFLTGEGKGSESRKALKTLREKVYPVLEKNEKVFLIIQTTNHESDKGDQ